MNVPSGEFLLFAVAGALIYNLLPGKVARWWLLALNLGFFSTFVKGWESVVPYAGFLLFGYAGVVALRRRPTTPVFLVFLLGILGSFFWLKKYVFVPDALTLDFAYTAIGLSYVFFRVLHLVIEVRQGSITEPVSPLSYLNYTLNFTALVSGPIQLYPDYREAELAPRRFPDLFTLGYAAERIATGFFKVAIVSVLLSKWQHSVLDHLQPGASLLAGAGQLALLCALYPLFLYANFSGYTDFVIGVGRLLRNRLPENFDNPFAAENVIAFWTRWHMSLSNWIKTYVYTPFLVALMRRFPSRTVEPYLGVLAYFVTFFLVGAWHGQTANFLVFGVMQGGGMALNKFYQVRMAEALTRKGYRALSANPLYRSFCRGLNFTWFTFTLLCFWSNWKQVQQIVATVTPVGFALAWLLMLAGSTLALAAMVAVQEGAAKLRAGGEPIVRSRYLRTITVTAMVVVTVASLVLLSGPAPDIVYKNF